MLMPRVPAMVYASLSWLRARIVALTKLWGLEEPLDLASTSFTPTLSRTARMAPPATRPVPAAAGRKNTSAPPKRASIS